MVKRGCWSLIFYQTVLLRVEWVRFPWCCRRNIVATILFLFSFSSTSLLFSMKGGLSLCFEVLHWLLSNKTIRIPPLNIFRKPLPSSILHLARQRGIVLGFWNLTWVLFLKGIIEGDFAACTPTFFAHVNGGTIKHAETGSEDPNWC